MNVPEGLIDRLREALFVGGSLRGVEEAITFLEGVESMRRNRIAIAPLGMTLVPNVPSDQMIRPLLTFEEENALRGRAASMCGPARIVMAWPKVLKAAGDALA